MTTVRRIFNDVNSSLSLTTHHLSNTIHHLRLNTYHPAFTIVELLVVIVVIGILATITIVSYTGISAKAIDASITTDLSNAFKKFKIHQVENGGYPTTIDCSTPNSASNICLKPSPNNQYTLTTNNSITSNQYFCIVILNTTSNRRQYITNDGMTGVGDCPTFTLTVIAGVGGTVGGGGSYSPGSTQTITATADGVHLFNNWSGAGCSTGVVMMDDNKTCTANFVVDTANWLIIGTQIWAKTNLNVGTWINTATYQTNNSILEKYCPENNASNCSTYGGLYQWDEAMQYVNTEGARGICPTGAHIPTDNDWKILEIQLGMTQAQADTTGYRGTDQGTKLKIGGTSGLNIPLAGNSVADGSFFGFSSGAALWSSSESGSDALYRYVGSSSANVLRTVYGKLSGFSVRCVGN